MEWLNEIRPWIVPVLALATAGFAATGKLRSILLAPLLTSISQIERSVKRLETQMEKNHQELREDHRMLQQLFTQHLITLHGVSPDAPADAD